MTNSTQSDGAAVDSHHMLVIGAGPGLGSALAHRFAKGGYRLTLMARRIEGLAKLASEIGNADTLAADASDPEGLRATLTSLYASTGAPGVLVYNASMLTPDSLLSSDVAHLHQAYDVDVIGAIVATQVSASAMRPAGGGTILFTGGGWADHPVPAWGTISLGKAALRSAATMLGADLADDGIRVASITIGGQIQPGTPFSPDLIAEKYWSVVQSDGAWQSEFRFDGK
jgi:NAD(P)-dependent dehydrogenase (short-subunit alcohol dehydrogenase family)